jgi:hypothetical protein
MKVKDETLIEEMQEMGLFSLRTHLLPQGRTWIRQPLKCLIWTPCNKESIHQLLTNSNLRIEFYAKWQEYKKEQTLNPDQ